MKKLLILAVCFATLAAQAQLQMNFGKESPLQKLQIAEMAIKNLYVDTVNENKLAEDAIKGSSVGAAHFSVRGGHFQLYDFFVQLATSFIFKDFLLEIAPIATRVTAFSQHGNDVNDGEIPFFRRFVPDSTDLGVVVKFYFFHLFGL